MEIVILLLISIPVLSWIYFRWTNRHIFKALKDLPDPFDFPLLGMCSKMIGKRIDEIYDICEPIIEKNITFKCWLGPLCHVVLRKPEDIKIVLNSTDCIEKHSIYRFLFPTTGLVTSPVSLWKHHRKLLNPVFSQGKLMSFIPIFNEQSNTLIECLRKNTGKNEFDIYEFISKCTLDMICATTMGYDLNCQNNENLKYLKARELYPECVFNRVVRLWHHPDFLYRFSSAYRKEKKFIDIICDFSSKIIKKTEMRMKNEVSIEYDSENDEIEYKKPQIFLEHVLKLKNSKQFTDQNVRDEVDTIIIAGHDTSALTISNILLLLAMHPDIQDRVYDEIKTFWKDPLDYNSLQNCTYLNMVINETMRVFPIAAFLLRKCMADTKIENFTIPAGVYIVLNLLHLSRNADMWGKDYKSFNPDNFLPENIEKMNSASFIPFSLGSRNCIGYKYALISIKIVIITILKNFKVHTSMKMDSISFVVDFMVKLKNKHLISLENR